MVPSVKMVFRGTPKNKYLETPTAEYTISGRPYAELIIPVKDEENAAHIKGILERIVATAYSDGRQHLQWEIQALLGVKR